MNTNIAKKKGSTAFNQVANTETNMTDEETPNVYPKFIQTDMPFLGGRDNMSCTTTNLPEASAGNIIFNQDREHNNRREKLNLTQTEIHYNEATNHPVPSDIY